MEKFKAYFSFVFFSCSNNYCRYPKKVEIKFTKNVDKGKEVSGHTNKTLNDRFFFAT